VIERLRRHDNPVRPHASLGYRPPAPEVFVPALRLAACATPTGSAGQAQASATTNHELVGHLLLALAF
jgi:putative transposase